MHVSTCWYITLFAVVLSDSSGLLGVPWSLPPVLAPLSPYTGATKPPPPPPATLDSETLKFIHRYFCRECQMEDARRKQGLSTSRTSPSGSMTSSSGQSESGGGAGAGEQPPVSPLMALDEASLQQTMDLNKECE